MNGIKVLALDFEGVLHPGNPVHSGRRYSRLPLLAMWLRLWPSVHVVISSSWRQRVEFDELRRLFPPTVQDSVLGAPALLRNVGYMATLCDEHLPRDKKGGQ